MAQLGNVQTVVVCVAGAEGVQGACPVDHVQSVTQAYLIAPTQAAFLDTSAEPFDAVAAGEFFGFSFASTILLWSLAYGAGQIVKLIKKS
jgi:hypothetical protein